MAKAKRPGPQQPGPHKNPQPRPTGSGRRDPSPALSAVRGQGFVDQLPSFFTNLRLQSLLIGALAFLLYANTLTHGFTLDDSIVISDNMFTKQGVKGIPGLLSKDTFFGFFKVEGKEALVTGGRYRPLTPVLFALIYQIFGANTFVFHLLTVLLYALTCVLLYRVLVRLFLPRFGEAPAALMAWLAALLFTVHPIHTEVVANIKGCDEIVTLLLCLGALDLMLRAYDRGKTSLAWLAGLVFFLACLSKENAAAFTVVIPLALWFFRGGEAAGPAGGKAPGRSMAGFVLPVWVAFLIFFILRGAILDWRFGGAPMELMNNPFLKIEGDQWVKFSFSERLATILYTLGKYVQLLIFPHPLTHDYYPRHIGRMTFADPGVLLSLALYAGLIWYAARNFLRRDPVAFGILFFLLTLSIVSNLVFPVGTNMGERFAFMPSVGFCIAVSVLLLRWKGASASAWKVPVGLAGAVALLFALKTLWRNPDWASNEKLFLTDVAVSGNSAKIRNACGGIMFDKGRVETDEAKRKDYARQAVEHLNKALEIYPNYKDAYMSRGGSQYLLENYSEAVADYRRAWQLAPDDARVRSALALVLRDGGKYFGEKKGDLATAMQYLTEAWQLNTKDPETARLLGVANGVQGKNADAMMWFGKAVELAPDNASYLFDLGTATAIGGDVVRGEEMRQRALQMDPELIQKRNQN